MAVTSYEINQKFNNDLVKGYINVTCSSADAVKIASLLVDGYEVYEPDGTPTATVKALPTTYKNLNVSAFNLDDTNGTYNNSFFSLKYVKASLTNETIQSLFKTNCKTNGNKPIEKVILKNMKLIA